MTHIKGNPYAGHDKGYEPPASYWKALATKQTTSLPSAEEFSQQGFKKGFAAGSARQETWDTRLKATKDARDKGLSPNEYEIRVVDVDIDGTMRKQFTWTMRSEAQIQASQRATGALSSRVVNIGGKRYTEISRGDIPIRLDPLPDDPTLTEADVSLVERPTVGDPNRIAVTVMAGGKVVSTFQYQKDKEPNLNRTFGSAHEAGALMGIPIDQIEVASKIVGGEQFFYPTIKPSGPDVSKAQTNSIPLGTNGDQGTLILYQVGDKVGQFHLPPKPGKTVQNTFRSATGVTVVYSDGTSEPIALDQFQLGTPRPVTDPRTGKTSYFLETAPGQFSRMPEAPGIKSQIVDGQQRNFLTDTSGNWRELPLQVEPGTFQDPNTGRWFEQQPSGAIREMDPRVQPGLIQEGTGTPPRRRCRPCGAPGP